MIGKVIATLLKANPDLLLLVPAERIFPYVINENTPLPAIIYTVDDIDPEYTKDGWEGDNIPFSVVSFSDNYATLQSVAEEVRKALELKKGTYSGTSIQRIYLTGQSEGYNITEDVFLNKLIFKVRTNK